jgi:hypothetical protein
MKTLKELNKPFQMENELSETRMKLITLDRRLRHLNRMNPKNWIEGLGIGMQKIGIQMQIKGILIRMKNSNPNIIK